ncbi:MAG: hypothetical protein HYT80_04920 [Euryarchaeota archaeon]|nr:hypothetical protein [Euryarchaeota archaeon]
MTASHRLGWLVALAVVASGCQSGTRPTEPDADVDGIPDAVELEGWNVTVRRTVAACFSGELQPEEIREVRSNELLIDTDADGVGDYEEFQLRSDPNDNDTDDDGLTDAEEFALRDSTDLYAGAFLRLNDADSDDDCLSDGEEVRGLVVPGLGLRVTDPSFFNTDGDAWSDPYEIHVSRTDPTNADTDGDGAPDHVDVDPLRDVLLRVDLQKVLLEESPDGKGRADVFLDWFVPTKPPTVRPTPRPRFSVAVGQETPVPANNTPGLVDLDDQQAGPSVELNIAAYYYTGPESASVLDINPYFPGQPLTLRFNVTSGQWAFRKADGGWTSDAKTTMVDAPTTRLWLAVAAESAP